MKIVDVCAFYAPRGGGVRTYIERKLAAGPAHGHEIVVVAPGPETREEVRGPTARIRWLRAPLFPLDTAYRYFADRPALHALLDAEDPDMLEVSSPWRSASMVMAWRGRARRALVAHADPLAAYAYRWFDRIADRPAIDRGFDWYWRHLRRLDARCDIVVSASDSLSRRLRAGGLRRVETIPMGVEPGVFSPAHRDLALRGELLRRCALPEHATLLLGIGRHGVEKRWELVAEAATAAASIAPVGLMIVGDGRARARLRTRIAGNPHIRLLAPTRDRPALARLLASADALVHGCDAETFCFATAEAVASGVPLIVPGDGGAADHARASGGRLYRPGDVADAARVIAAFAANRPPRPQPGPQRTMDDHFTALFGRYAAIVDMAEPSRSRAAA